MSRARLLLLAALVLPLAGLGWAWAGLERLSRTGSEWEVPVRGYDPRDLLQGHYLAYSYDWPGEVGPRSNRWDAPGELCLLGTPPKLAGVEPAHGQSCPARLRAADSAGGRYYLPRERALDLQRRLADRSQQGLIRIRLRADGHAVPLGLTFRSRGP